MYAVSMRLGAHGSSGQALSLGNQSRTLFSFRGTLHVHACLFEHSCLNQSKHVTILN